MTSLGVKAGVLVVQRRTSDKYAEKIIEINNKVKHESYNNDERDTRPRSCFGKTNFQNSKMFHIKDGNCKVDNTALDAIAKISLEVNEISKQITTLGVDIFGGKRVSEKDVLNLSEKLMTELLKLDEIVTNGDAKIMRKEQVRRVQKYLEDLDRMKIKNASNEIKSMRPIRRPLIYFS